MSFKGQPISVIDKGSHHISMHSSVLEMWFTSIYSTDKLAVGAHFNVGKSGRGPLISYILLGMLTDNNLDLLNLCKMLFSLKGLLFFFNRREEIIGLIISRSFMSDYQKE